VSISRHLRALFDKPAVLSALVMVPCNGISAGVLYKRWEGVQKNHLLSGACLFKACAIIDVAIEMRHTTYN
jgi:hypothetical protein